MDKWYSVPLTFAGIFAIGMLKDYWESIEVDENNLIPEDGVSQSIVETEPLEQNVKLEKNVELEEKNVKLEQNVELEEKNVELEEKNVELEEKNVELEEPAIR